PAAGYGAAPAGGRGRSRGGHRRGGRIPGRPARAGRARRAEGTGRRPLATPLPQAGGRGPTGASEQTAGAVSESPPHPEGPLTRHVQPPRTWVAWLIRIALALAV